MSINRNNYEEFFILYMDNELGIEDRRQVEEFLKKNSDLQEEMDILLQYKMVPDTGIVFAGKEDLMKLSGNTPISMVNAEEWMILSMDNELNTAQQSAFNQFLALYPTAKDQLSLLMRTQLQPEKIIYPDKESLYKKETRVRPIGWWRMAAAAAIVTAISITAAIVMNKKSTTVNNPNESVATLPANNQKQNQVAPLNNGNKENKLIIPESAVVNPVDHREMAQSTIKTMDGIATKKQPYSNDKVLRVKSLSNDVSPVLATNTNNDQPNNNLPKRMNDIKTTELVKNPIASISPEIKASGKSLTNDDVTSKNVQPLYTSNGAITSDDENTLEHSDGKKSKLRGFFRKLTRTFEKNTNLSKNNEDDKVLIGGLAIKL